MPTTPLPKRLAQIQGLIGQGLTDREIANALGISYGTVKVCNSRLYGKRKINRHRIIAEQATRSATHQHLAILRGMAENATVGQAQTLFEAAQAISKLTDLEATR